MNGVMDSTEGTTLQWMHLPSQSQHYCIGGTVSNSQGTGNTRQKHHEHSNCKCDTKVSKRTIYWELMDISHVVYGLPNNLKPNEQQWKPLQRLKWTCLAAEGKQVNWTSCTHCHSCNDWLTFDWHWRGVGAMSGNIWDNYRIFWHLSTASQQIYTP